MERTLVTLLRVAFAMCFIGHGAFGILRKVDWLPFFSHFGIDAPLAVALMPVVGVVDITIGLLALVLPVRAVFAYGAAWCLFTAALRPMTGLGVAEFLERAGNYGIPLAMIAATRGAHWFRRIPADLPSRTRQDVYAIAVWTTATLLAGHAWLALQSKPLLVNHLSILGLGSNGAPLVGVFELSLAVACIVRPTLGLFTVIAAWKVASEGLFIAAGAPVWEFVERGGSYVAPVIAAYLVPAQPVPVLSSRLARAGITAVVLATLPAGLVAQSPGGAAAAPTLLEQLRRGGLVVACRHGITSHARGDKQPVDFDDPTTQRVLNADGEAQAAALGEEWRALKIPFGAVAASPYDRARRTAMLAVGRVDVDPALSMHTGDRGDALKQLMHGPVAPGANRLVVTHQGVIYKSFTSVKQGSVAEGACVVARPGDPSAEVLGIVKPGQWGGAEVRR